MDRYFNVDVCFDGIWYKTFTVIQVTNRLVRPELPSGTIVVRVSRRSVDAVGRFFVGILPKELGNVRLSGPRQEWSRVYTGRERDNGVKLQVLYCNLTPAGSQTPLRDLMVSRNTSPTMPAIREAIIICKQNPHLARAVVEMLTMALRPRSEDIRVIPTVFNLDRFTRGAWQTTHQVIQTTQAPTRLEAGPREGTIVLGVSELGILNVVNFLASRVPRGVWRLTGGRFGTICAAVPSRKQPPPSGVGVISWVDIKSTVA